MDIALTFLAFLATYVLTLGIILLPFFLATMQTWTKLIFYMLPLYVFRALQHNISKIDTVLSLTYVSYSKSKSN